MYSEIVSSIHCPEPIACYFIYLNTTEDCTTEDGNIIRYLYSTRTYIHMVIIQIGFGCLVRVLRPTQHCLWHLLCKPSVYDLWEWNDISPASIAHTGHIAHDGEA